MAEQRDEPINGPVRKTEWIDEGGMIAHVEHPETGEIWIESYSFREAEKLEE